MVKYENGKIGNLVEAFPSHIDPNNTLRHTLSVMLMNDIISLCVVTDHGTFEGLITYKNIQEAIKTIYMDDIDDE